jgi:hypothetical protein
MIPLSKRFVRNYSRRADLFCARCFTKGTSSYKGKWTESAAEMVAAKLIQQGWVIDENSVSCPACAGHKPKEKHVVYRTVRWGRTEKLPDRNT